MKSVLALFAFSSLLAQAPSAPSAVRVFRPQWTNVPLQGVQQSLAVLFSKGFSGNWVLGAKVTATATDHVEIADASFPRMSGQAASVPAVGAYPTSQIALSGAEVVIGGGTPQHTVLIYLETSHPISLTVPEVGTQPIQVSADSSVVIRNGTVASTTLLGAFQLVPLAMPNGAVNPEPMLSKDGAVDLFDLAYLRSHLIRYVEFPSIDRGIGPMTTFATLHITPEGIVTGVDCRTSRVPASVCKSITETITQWTFQPITYNGATVAARARVIIIIGSDGQLRSGLSPSISPL